MWEVSAAKEAEFRANGWKLVVSSVEQGITLLACREGAVASTARFYVPDAHFPPPPELFVRGDEVHLSRSDLADHPFGLDLVLTAIEADQTVLVIESIVSLRTSLLDSSPVVEMQIGVGHPSRPRWGDARWVPAGSDRSTLWLDAQGGRAGGGVRTALHVACDQRDRCSIDADKLFEDGRLKFFGDFLEKGVVRRVQPWLIWSRGPLSNQAVNRIAKALASRPLPLAT